MLIGMLHTFAHNKKAGQPVVLLGSRYFCTQQKRQANQPIFFLIDSVPTTERACASSCRRKSSTTYYSSPMSCHSKVSDRLRTPLIVYFFNKHTTQPRELISHKLSFNYLYIKLSNYIYIIYSTLLYINQLRTRAQDNAQGMIHAHNTPHTTTRARSFYSK